MSLDAYAYTHASNGARLADRDRFGLEPPPRKAVAPPSRTSTCFSALTMTSSDDHAFERTRDGVEQDDFGMELSYSSDDPDTGELAASTALSFTQEDGIPELSFDTEESDDTEESEAESARNSAEVSEAESDADSLTLDDFGSDQDELGREEDVEDASLEMSFVDSDTALAFPSQTRSENAPAVLDVDRLDTAVFGDFPTDSPPAKRRKLQLEVFVGGQEGRHGVGAHHVGITTTTEPPASAPRSPTQAEMDAFFGFVDPLAPYTLATKAAARKTAQKSLDEPAVAQAVGAIPRDAAPIESSLAREPGSRRGGKHRTESSCKSSGSKRYYQLEPIPSVSPDTGRALIAAEKRSLIVASLERVALSVLQQIADHVLPALGPYHASDPSADEQRTSSTRGKAAADSVQPITVVLAKRGGSDRATSRATQSLKYPRKYGKGDEVRLGCRELAVFVRVVQMLLDGLSAGTISTKRDLYYRDVSLFRKQAAVDTMIDDIAATLRVRRSDLGVVATSKGLFAGAIQLAIKSGSTLSGGSTPGLIPPGQAIRWMILTEVRWILVVEKDAVFTTLNDAGLTQDPELGNGVLITGKGYPDVASREFVKRLADCASGVPLFALVDCDPYGLDIMATYRFGSSAQAHEAIQLAAPTLRWLGLRLEDAVPSSKERDKLLPLKSSDRLKVHSLLSRASLPQSWRHELERMLHFGYKAETEILTGGDYTRGRENPGTGSRSALVDFVRAKLRQALYEIQVQ